MKSSLFLNALNKTNHGSIPVWFMRQAGRYLPEYQALRKKHDFRTMSHTPELICETTLTPFSRYKLDAAILFSDILTCLEFMGSTFHFGEGGPKLEASGPSALKRLKKLTPAQDMNFVGQGIRLVKEKLPNTPLIGFAGAPFTLISYLVEGGTSREFVNTRKLLLEEPIFFDSVMELLGESISDYLVFQFECGVDAVQIFDSWVGVLSQNTYKKHVFPVMKKMIEKLQKKGIPVILYSQPTSHLLLDLKNTQANAISLDWREELSSYVQRLSDGDTMTNLPTIQGNLDPLVTTLTPDQALPFVRAILDQVFQLEIQNQFIFNVGHGVLPETKHETISEIINYVRSY